MPQSPADMLRDSLYVTVGFGVITFQKLQVRRRRIEKALESHLGSPIEQARRLFGHD